MYMGGVASGKRRPVNRKQNKTKFVEARNFLCIWCFLALDALTPVSQPKPNTQLYTVCAIYINNIKLTQSKNQSI